MWREGNALAHWWECKLIQPLQKTVWQFPKKLGIKTPSDPEIPLLGICPEETKIEKDTRIPLFIVAQFTIARTQKQPRCPSTDGWIKKLWHIYIMEYYSVIERNTFESVLMRYMNLEPMIQSELSQKEKDKYHILTYIYTYMESRQMVLKNLFTGQQWRNRHRKQTYQHGERGGEGEMYGKSNMEIYITIWKIANWNLLYGLGNFNRGSVSIQRGWLGQEMGGRFKREQIYVYLWLIHVDI